MKIKNEVYLVMGLNYESDENYPIKGFYIEDDAEKFKSEMKEKSPDEHFYWVLIGVQ